MSQRVACAELSCMVLALASHAPGRAVRFVDAEAVAIHSVDRNGEQDLIDTHLTGNSARRGDRPKAEEKEAI